MCDGKRIAYAVLLILMLSSCGGGGSGFSAAPTKAELGRKLFTDEALSSGRNQSCATCHDLQNPDVSGFADPTVSKAAPVSLGSDGFSFGNRNAPTVAYASFSPPFALLAPAEQTGETDSKYRGGQFVDGRASDLVAQAKAPFLNPKEMNLSKAEVVARVSVASYASDFLAIYGDGALDNVDVAFDNIADAIAEFEKTSELNAFTSKYDAYLLGQVSLSAQETRGLNLFKDKNRARCANCHTFNSTVGSARSESLFTNFEYYNVGTPVNFSTPTSLVIDLGLGGGDATGEVAEEGKFKVPTLRNIELTGPYMHNGVYASLEDVINHYDLFGTDNIFPAVDRNIAVEMGDRTIGNAIGLSAQEVQDIKAFMLTLTDGYF